MLERVKLETSDGGHVGWTEIPRFRPCADVLFWGERVFRYRDVMRGHLLYREAFAFTVVTPVTERPPPPSETP